MADITFTTTELKKADNNAKVETWYSAEAIAIGDAVYLSTASKLAKGDNNGGTGGSMATVRGIALSAAEGVDQPVTIITEGNLTCDGLTKGTVYALSATAGKICPVADLASGNYVSVIGIATSTTNLLVKPIVSGAAM
jgi:hypothetical protein